MRLALYAPVALAASAFVAFTAVHTDEETFTLGVILLLGIALGVAFPKQALASIALIGLPVCFMETFANYGFVHAPYQTHPGISWAALVALIPAALGTIAGAWSRLHARSVVS